MAAGSRNQGSLQVDDLLAAHGLRLLGADAVSAVTVDHAGFQLFPLDEDTLPACGGGTAHTAAALVPLAMVPGSGSSDDGSEACT